MSLRKQTASSISLAALIVMSAVTIIGLNNAPAASATFPGENGKIAFSSGRDNGLGEGARQIYVMNPDGSGQTRLTKNSASDDAPSWSPDGTQIVFQSDRDGNAEIYVVNADGSGQTRLTKNLAADELPSYSPDGSKIVFVSNRDGNREIYVMNKDGSGQTRLTNNIADDMTPSFSPDGARIVFETTLDGSAEIYVMDADGSEQTNLTNSPSGEHSPSFSPDGKKITFHCNDGSQSGIPIQEVCIMDADGNNRTRLTDTSSQRFPSQNSDPRFSPDGMRIVFSSRVKATAYYPVDLIYIINVDGSGLTNLTPDSYDNFQPSWQTLNFVLKQTLTVNSVEQSGNSLSGMWTTIRTLDGTLLKSGFTPLTFTGIAGTDYKVSVADYGGKTFNHWQDNGSTIRSRIIDLTSDTTNLTAIFNASGVTRGFTPIDTSGGRWSLTVNAISLDDGRELHMSTVIDDRGSAYEGGTQRYTVYINNYKDRVFDHWEDGSTSSVRTLETLSPTTITAYYHKG